MELNGYKKNINKIFEMLNKFITFVNTLYAIITKSFICDDC